MGLSPEVAGAVPRARRARRRDARGSAREGAARERALSVHELSLAGAVIDTAERHAGGRRVVLIQLRLGELRQVVPDSLSFYFEHVARGTLCEGAVLEYEAVARPALRLRPSCTRRLRDARRGAVRSAARAAVGPTWPIESGNEFEVESIEVEEPACTG